MVWPTLGSRRAKEQNRTALRITNRPFRNASPCLWNQLPSSLRQHYSSPSVSVLPVHAPTTSFHSLNSPLSPPIIPSLFHSRLKTYLFYKSPPHTLFQPPDWLHGLYDWTVSSEHSHFLFLHYSFCFFCSMRQIKLAIHHLLGERNILYLIVWSFFVSIQHHCSVDSALSNGHFQLGVVR